MYLCLIWLFKFKITLPSTLFKFLLMCFAKLFFGYSLSIWYPNFTSFNSFQYFRTTILFSCIKSFHSLNRLIPLSILKCNIFWFNWSILHDIEIALVQRVLLPELLCEKDQFVNLIKYISCHSVKFKIRSRIFSKLTNIILKQH